MYYDTTEYIDTRDLDEKRLNLKDEVIEIFERVFKDKIDFENYSYEDYASIVTFKENYHFNEQLLHWFNETFKANLENVDLIKEFCNKVEDNIAKINEIDVLEEEINAYSDENFKYGVTLIPINDFENYCEEFVNDCGYITKDTPNLITSNINWAGVANDMKYDYTEVEFRSNTYLFR